mmetsp:Transcript_2305/g.3819  ORF Transcript_2305/g.3819 Transcript_2305/m.3819 type:complete len:296 (-) Transcript_2305:507-1394(-)
MEHLLNLHTSGQGAGAFGVGQCPDMPIPVDEQEAQQLRQQANHIWEYLDKMAQSDPKAYKAFIQEQAQAAEKAAEDAKPPGVHVAAAAAPLLLLGTVVSGIPASQPNGQAKPKVGQRMVIHIFSSDQVPAAHVDGLRVQPGWDPSRTQGRVCESAADTDALPYMSTLATTLTNSTRDSDGWAGVCVPCATALPPSTQVPTHVPGVRQVNIAVHSSSIDAAAKNEPGAMTAVVVEAVCQFVAHAHGVHLDRTTLTLQVDERLGGVTSDNWAQQLGSMGLAKPSAKESKRPLIQELV